MSVTTEAGRAIRECHCEKHGPRYPQTYFANLDHWVGGCEQCQQEEALGLQARQILATREAEKQRRVKETYKPDEKQITAATDAEIERRAQEIVDRMESHRYEIEAEIRHREWERAADEVEAEMLAEIIESLKEAKQ